jgi:hypothetical protein
VGTISKGHFKNWELWGCYTLHTGTQVFVSLLSLETKNRNYGRWALCKPQSHVWTGGWLSLRRFRKRPGSSGNSAGTVLLLAWQLLGEALPGIFCSCIVASLLCTIIPWTNNEVIRLLKTVNTAGGRQLLQTAFAALTTLHSIEDQTHWSFPLKVRASHWVHGALFFVSFWKLPSSLLCSHSHTSSMWYI